MVMTMVTKDQRSIKASEFKARCLRLLDEVAASGEALVITKRGKPIGRLVPYRERPASLYALLAGSVEVRGDIVAPLDVEWEANR